MYPRSLDERVTCNVLLGRAEGEKRPDLVLCILSAINLRRNLRLVLAAKRLGLPCVVVLNMLDIAKRHGLVIDTDALSKELGLPVLTSIGIQSDGADAIKTYFDRLDWRHLNSIHTNVGDVAIENVASHIAHSETDNVQVQRILHNLGLDQIIPDRLSDRLDSVLLHPVFGPIILAALLFLIFQAVFSWATLPMELIKSSVEYFGGVLIEVLPNNWFRSLLINGVLAGLGGVIIFLPQILILFFFILLLEESGYLPRAAYLLDRVMGSVGLSGRSFIPLLSSFACAIPGIMATRSISNARDRLVTILIAPMMTCSARLPVYAQKPTKIVLFDLSRTTETSEDSRKHYLDGIYSLAEDLKNGRIVSTKYESKTVFFPPPHVIFFANFEPDYTKWSEDRYFVTKL